MSGLGANIFSPLLNVANVEIPKSIPIELLVMAKCSEQVSITKLAMLGRLAESLIIVTEVGLLANALDQMILILPTFGRYILS